MGWRLAGGTSCTVQRYLVKAVAKDGQRLVAQQRDQAGQMLQLLVRAHADAQAPDGAHPVLQQPHTATDEMPDQQILRCCCMHGSAHALGLICRANHTVLKHRST